MSLLGFSSLGSVVSLRAQVRLASGVSLVDFAKVGSSVSLR
jgi:hypothetical protein